MPIVHANTKLLLGSPLGYWPTPKRAVPSTEAGGTTDSGRLPAAAPRRLSEKLLDVGAPRRTQDAPRR